MKKKTNDMEGISPQYAPDGSLRGYDVSVSIGKTGTDRSRRMRKWFRATATIEQMQVWRTFAKRRMSLNSDSKTPDSMAAELLRAPEVRAELLAIMRAAFHTALADMQQRQVTMGGLQS